METLLADLCRRRGGSLLLEVLGISFLGLPTNVRRALAKQVGDDGAERDEIRHRYSFRSQELRAK